MTSCTSLEGWNQWSVWSLCDARGEQHRARHCMVSEPGGELCQGEDRQARLCVDTGDESVLLAATGTAPAIGTGRMVAACLGCFCTGALLATVCTYYHLTRRRHPGVRSSKYYDALPKAVSPNAYVTVRGVPGVHELAELKNGRRRNGSVKGGELVSEKTATIRRSGSTRYNPVSAAELRANLASDAIY
ncbi:semaphorin-5B-like [Pollicipes pollicipes]|uniref:semaphorin-5B-like n=1 Tax=Pollicipes pollicipes TaxID=41117 RepID=UPI001884A03C|nr:semaphorin-5B-like [Pollicipes pollicipes]